jgi:hypothetical protein
MAFQAVGMAVILVVALQLVLFACSPLASLKLAYVDSWRQAGTVLLHLFQLQRGPDQWAGFAALGLMAYIALVALALDVAGRYLH